MSKRKNTRSNPPRKIQKPKEIYIKIEIKSRKKRHLIQHKKKIKIPPELSELKESFINETNPAKKKTIMKAMALTLYKKYPMNILATFFDVSRQTVWAWIYDTDFNQKRKNYNCKSSNLELREFIKNQGLKKTDNSVRKITNKIKYSLEPNLINLPKISNMTTHKILRAELARPLKLRITFGLNEKQIIKRYEFTQFIKNKGIMGRNIIFTDEKIFNLSNHPNLQNTRVRLTREEHEQLLKGNEQVREKLMTVYTRKTQGIMVGGAITSAGDKLLIFIFGNEDASVYAEMLRIFKCFYDDLKKRNPESEYYFMQDGARSHTEKNNLKYIQDNMESFDWPAHSPDLNPIENIWAIMSSKLNIKDYKNIPELVRTVTDIWINIPLSLTYKLCNSFDTRIDYVNKAIGGRYQHEKTKNFIPHVWGTKKSTFKDRQFVVFGKEAVITLKRKHKHLINLYVGLVNRQNNSIFLKNFKTTPQKIIEKTLKKFKKINQLILKALQYALKISKEEAYLNILDCYDIDQIIFQGVLPTKYKNLFRIFNLPNVQLKNDENNKKEIEDIEKQLILPNKLKPFPQKSSFLALEYVLTHLSPNFINLIEELKENLRCERKKRAIKEMETNKIKKEPKSKSTPSKKKSDEKIKTKNKKNDDILIYVSEEEQDKEDNFSNLNTNDVTIDPFENDQTFEFMKKLFAFIPNDDTASKTYDEEEMNKIYEFDEINLDVGDNNNAESEEEVINSLLEAKETFSTNIYEEVKFITEKKIKKDRHVKNLYLPPEIKAIEELFDREIDNENSNKNVTSDEFNQIRLSEFNSNFEKQEFINNPLKNPYFGTNIDPFFKPQSKKDNYESFDDFNIEIINKKQNPPVDSSLLGKKREKKKRDETKEFKEPVSSDKKTDELFKITKN